MSGSPVAVDLFCGAGGLSTGLSWAGFDIDWATDQSEKATATYRSNHPDTSVVTANIRNLDPGSINASENIDLVAGGPPCPTFSRIGRSKLNSLREGGASADERHQLWQEFVRFVDELEPEVFLMENVEGMESATNELGEPVLPIIRESFESTGYRTSYCVLDAADFGVPQHRRRLFIVGSRTSTHLPDFSDRKTHRKPRTSEEKEARLLVRSSPDESQRTLDSFEGFSEIATTGNGESISGKKPWITVGEAILDLPPLSPAKESGDQHPPTSSREYLMPPVTEYQKWARDIPSDSSWDEMTLWNHEARGHNLQDLSIYKLLGQGMGFRIGDLQDDLQPYRSDVFSDNYTKQRPDEPASTILAHIEKDGHMYIHPTEARSLTVREAARIQSFRDTYRFPVSRTAAFGQVGNAVPPLLAEKLGEAIQETLL